MRTEMQTVDAQIALEMRKKASIEVGARQRLMQVESDLE